LERFCGTHKENIIQTSLVRQLHVPAVISAASILHVLPLNSSSSFIYSQSGLQRFLRFFFQTYSKYFYINLTQSFEEMKNDWTKSNFPFFSHSSVKAANFS
jgi:hypothetical protein